MRTIVSFDVGIRNLAYCVLEVDAEHSRVSIDKWSVVELCEKNQSKKLSLVEICNRLIDALDLCAFDGDMEIVIENQPVLKNPKMKSIQTMLFTYFVLLGCEHITLFSARNKLKAYDGPPVTDITVKSSYTRRKKLSIRYCSYYVQSNDKYSAHFSASKKKDDLADCFMQGISFLKKTHKWDTINLI